MPIKALVVDDSPIVQRAHKILLEQAGCEVDVAASAEQALVLQPHLYQIIFMDLNLPTMDGIKLTQEIRKLERSVNFSIPIIGISAASNERDKIEHSIKAGINELIAKPITREQVNVLIQRWVTLQ